MVRTMAYPTMDYSMINPMRRAHDDAPQRPTVHAMVVDLLWDMPWYAPRYMTPRYMTPREPMGASVPWILHGLLRGTCYGGTPRRPNKHSPGAFVAWECHGMHHDTYHGINHRNPARQMQLWSVPCYFEADHHGMPLGSPMEYTMPPGRPWHTPRCTP